jgi:hypothetical protein
MPAGLCATKTLADRGAEAKMQAPFEERIEEVIFSGGDVDHLNPLAGGAGQGGKGPAASLGGGEEDDPVDLARFDQWQGGKGHPRAHGMGDDLQGAA